MQEATCVVTSLNVLLGRLAVFCALPASLFLQTSFPSSLPPSWLCVHMLAGTPRLSPPCPTERSALVPRLPVLLFLRFATAILGLPHFQKYFRISIVIKTV